MEALRNLAVSRYNLKTTPAKELNNRLASFFNKLDSNGDKKVSFEELRCANIISDNLLSLFNTLDANGDGVLDYTEIAVLYYYKYFAGHLFKEYEPTPRICSGSSCSVRMDPMPEFSCFACLDYDGKSYHLCSSCHARGEHHKHEHYDWYVLSRESLVLLYLMKFLLFENTHKVGKAKYDTLAKGINKGIDFIIDHKDTAFGAAVGATVQAAVTNPHVIHIVTQTAGQIGASGNVAATLAPHLAPVVHAAAPVIHAVAPKVAAHVATQAAQHLAGVAVAHAAPHLTASTVFHGVLVIAAHGACTIM